MSTTAKLIFGGIPRLVDWVVYMTVFDSRTGRTANRRALGLIGYLSLILALVQSKKRISINPTDFLEPNRFVAIFHGHPNCGRELLACEVTTYRTATNKQQNYFSQEKQTN